MERVEFGFVEMGSTEDEQHEGVLERSSLNSASEREAVEGLGRIIDEVIFTGYRFFPAQY